MAVMLYKGDEVVRVEVGSLQAHLKAGYSLEDPSKAKPEPAEYPDVESPRELRERAKEAGVENWETAKLKTLRAVLDDQKD